MSIYGNKIKTVVFDIDGVIACAPGRYGRRREDEVLKKVVARFGEDFVKAHSFIVSGFHHFIYPGVFEFIRWLVRRGIRIHFYSTGAKERNDPLVKMVLERALENEVEHTFEEVSREMTIISRESMEEQHRLNERFGLYESSVYGGNHHKVLCPYLVDYRALPDTLLIDDDTSYMAHGEEYNFVGGRYYECFYEGDSAKPEECTVEDFIELCRTFLFAGVVGRILNLADDSGYMSLTEASKHVQYGMGDDGYQPEDCTYFENTFYDLSFYEDGLKILREVNPQLDFPLPVPVAFRDNSKRFPPSFVGRRTPSQASTH